MMMMHFWLDHPRGQTVIGRGVRLDLSRFKVGLKHYCAQSGCLDGVDPAADVLQDQCDVAEVAIFGAVFLYPRGSRSEKGRGRFR